MIKTASFFTQLILIATIFLAGGCADIRPIWVGQAELDTLTLYFSEPVEFQIRFSHPEPEVNTALEFALTYDQSINQSSIPLFMTLEDRETHRVTEYKADLLIKQDGQWLGYPVGNEVDYTVNQIVLKDLSLKPGQNYTLKIFANDEEEEEIYGIIRLGARLYLSSELSTEEVED